MTLSHPLNNTTAKRIIGELLTTGKYILIPHALKALQEDGLTTVDCVNVLRGGWVVQSEMKGGAWRYRIVTQRIAVIVEIELESEPQELTVITVFRLRESFL